MMLESSSFTNSYLFLDLMNHPLLHSELREVNVVENFGPVSMIACFWPSAIAMIEVLAKNIREC